MKKLLLVCLLAIGASAMGFAQGPPQRTPAEQLERLKTQITGITDAQATKITAIYAAQAKTRDSLMAAGGDFSAMAPLRTATNAKIKAVLTADQQKAFDALPQGRGPGGGPGGPGGGGAPPRP